MNNVFQFGSGYRLFCWPWFRHWLQPRTYYKPFVRAYQRATRGWADCDVWSIDSHLSNIIPPMVRHLQKTSHGYPGDMFGADEEEQIANWNSILEAIAVGFEAVQKMDDMPDRFFTELETSTGWHKDVGMKDREYDWDGYRAYQADQEQILANGFYLFQHRFRSLWD